MISVGSSSNGRKELGLGFGGGGRGGEMVEDDAEIEEGEACYYSNVGHDESAGFDPDVDLSYFDKKIEDILGHFQKDFEGGVSAENLGAKFGGYGSFLPSCPRSPSALSHPKTAQKLQNPNTSRSPSNLQPENPTGPPSARVGRIPPIAVQPPISMVSPVENLSKKDLFLSSGIGTGELMPKHEPLNKSIHQTDQKTLKVRIKVGPDSKLVQKNAAIYSGLGLDGSPSSSVEDSPTQSRGYSLGSQEALGQSPMSIVQDMTSFPISGGCLLSPLSESLLCLMERGMIQKESRDIGTGLARKASEESSAMSSYEESVASRASDQVIRKQKNNLVPKRSVEVNNKNAGNGVLSKKEMEIETPDETWESTICHDVKNIDNLKTNSASICEEKQAGFHGDVYFDSRKDGQDLVDGSVDIIKQVGIQKSASHGLDELITSYPKELPPSVGKKKSKESQCAATSVTEFSKENLKMDSRAPAKDKKKSGGDRLSRGKSDGKLHKKSERNRESHENLFKDVEEAEKRLDLSETQFKDGLRDRKADTVGKPERSRGEKLHMQSMSKANAMAAPDPSLTRSGPVSDVIPSTANTILVNEDWVCCDRCGKWRLLPYGTNAEQLQKSQWLCSMLYWLPGKNRCDVSEDETTKALEALYYGNQNNQQNHAEGTASGIPLVDTRHFGQDKWDRGLPAAAGGQKKKHKVKGALNAIMNPMKNRLPSFKSKNNVKQQSPLKIDHGNKSIIHHSIKSSDVSASTERYVQKGDSTHLKMKGKRGADHDESRASKKSKTGSLYYADEDQNSGHGEIKTKESQIDVKDRFPACSQQKKIQVQVSFSGGAPDLGKSDKINISAKSDKIDISAKKRKVKNWQVSQTSLPPVGLHDHHLQDNRRVLKDDYVEDKFNEGQETRWSKDEHKESRTGKRDSKLGKKHRLTQDLISGGKVSDGMQGKDNASASKGQQLGQLEGMGTGSQNILDGIDSSRRDLGYGQVSVAATSSSSKVSSSHRSKANCQVKSSPVESVSSSPIRLSNPNKVMSARNSLTGKDDAANVGTLITGALKRCSNEGDGVGDQCQMMRDEKVSYVFQSVMVDNQQKYSNHTSSDKIQALTRPHQDSRHLNKLDGSEHIHGERLDKSCSRPHGALPRKSGKGSSRSRDKHGSSNSSCDKAMEISNSFSEQEELFSAKKTRREMELRSLDHSHSQQESGGGRFSYQGKFGVKTTKDGRDCSGKQDIAEKCLNESRKGNRYVKEVSPSVRDKKVILQQDLEEDLEEPLDSSVLDRREKSEAGAIKRGNSRFLPYSDDRRENTLLQHPQPSDEAHRGSGSNVFPLDAAGGRVEVPKVLQQPSKTDNQNGVQSSSLRHSAANALDAPSPIRKDSSSQIAANALREATDLKHKADRLKNSGTELESTGLYFRAALKFLHGASLLEPCNYESAKHGEMTQSMHVYGDTAKLCEFVAHDYERCKSMAAAALAYKCAEVAYLRVMYSKQFCASRDRQDLQKALQMVPPGESPSSSASDLDNLNNQGAVDKVVAAKGVNSPLVTGNHVIVAQKRPSFLRLLTFAQDSISAMDASRKCLSAFAAANAGFEEARNTEGILSVKRAIDINFHDIDRLVHLVRLAMEAINP